MMQVVILAAGKGKRMAGPLPKVLRKVDEKTMIERVVDTVLKSGLTTRPVVVIGYGTEIIQEYLGKKCDYVLQKAQLGTAHAVLCVKDNLSDASDVLVLYGDHPSLKPETLTRLKQAHDEGGAVITMMTVKLPNFDGWRKVFDDFGRIIRDSNGNIEAIVEKRDATPEELAIKEVNPSFFCFKTQWLWENLPKIERNNAQGEYYLTDLVHLAISENEKVNTLTIEDPAEAVGVNTEEQLSLAESLTKARV